MCVFYAVYVHCRFSPVKHVLTKKEKNCVQRCLLYVNADRRSRVTFPVLVAVKFICRKKAHKVPMQLQSHNQQGSQWRNHRPEKVWHTLKKKSILASKNVETTPWVECHFMMSLHQFDDLLLLQTSSLRFTMKNALIIRTKYPNYWCCLVFACFSTNVTSLEIPTTYLLDKEEKLRNVAAAASFQ